MMGGQLLSLFGSHLVTFSFAVWVFTLTGSVVQMALLSILGILPTVLISPIAGVIADRALKKKTLILVDSLLAVVSVIVLILSLTGQLEPWHLYISAFLGGSAAGIQRPLFESITPMMVPKERLVNVNGVVQTVAGISQLLSPALAGALVVGIGLKAVLLFDLATFFVALITLLIVRIPEQTDDSHRSDNWKQDLALGFRYVFDRKGLRAMFLFVTVRNFAFAVCEVLALPLLLTLTTADRAGLVLSLSGIGVVVGGILMSLTGGTRRKINSVFIAQFLTAIAMVLAAVTTNLWLLGFAVAMAFVAFPVEESTSTSIMQAGVPKGLMGRVASVRQMMTLASVPIAMLISAPLAEYVFEPGLQDSGRGLWQLLGGIVGVGEGRGMALMLLLMGILLAIVTILGMLYRPLVNVENEPMTVAPNARSRAPESMVTRATAPQTATSALHHSDTQNMNESVRQQTRTSPARRPKRGIGAFFAQRPYLISLALIGAALLWLLLPGAPGPSPQASTAGSERAVLQTVQVSETAASATELAIEFTAQTEPKQSARIASQLEGVLLEKVVPAGSRVEQGTLIARISAGALESALSGARAEQSFARIESKAQKNLDSAGLTTRVGRANSYAALQAANARVNQLEQELEKTSVIAPIDGVVAEYYAEVGDFMGVGQPLLSLINTSPINAVGHVSERDIHKLQTGQRATVTVTGGHSAQGTVSYISPITDPATRTFKVEVTIDNAAQNLVSGVTARVRVPVGQAVAHKISPALLTLNAEGGVQVATVDHEDTVRLFEVDIVLSEADGVWVSGLPADARIITLGQGFVREGSVVQVMDRQAPEIAVPASRADARAGARIGAGTGSGTGS